MIIAIASTKGGVGKSTLAMQFAHAIQICKPDMKILLMDADPQATCLNWGRWRAEQEISPFIDVQPINQKGIKTILDERLKQYDVILIDVGGADNPNLRRALVHVDAVIIPTSLDPAERIHTFDMISLVDVARDEYNPSMITFMIFNRIKATSERNFLQQFRDGFPSFVHWIDGFIMHRVAFSRVYSQGKTIYDLIDDEEDKKAKQEVTHAIEQVLSILGEEKNVKKSI